MIERDVPFDVLFGQRGHAGRDLSVNWHVVDPLFLKWRDQRARFAGVTLEKSFLLERGDVLHHRCLTRETKMTLDFTCAWGQSALALFALDEIENFFLAIGEHELSIAGLNCGASSNEHLSLLTPRFSAVLCKEVIENRLNFLLSARYRPEARC
jgi:hypothetical protein